MKFSQFKRVQKEDLAKAGGEIPKWLDALLAPLNLFIENVALALQNRLNFTDNFYCKEITLSLTTGVEQEINPTTPFAKSARAYGVLILSSNNNPVSSYAWANKTNGNVGLTVNFLAVAESSVTLLFLLR